MNDNFDMWETRLQTLRPARLPAATRAGILREMEQMEDIPRRTGWELLRWPKLRLAVAGALAVVVVAGMIGLGHDRVAGVARSRDQQTPAQFSGVVLNTDVRMLVNYVAVVQFPWPLTNHLQRL